MKARFFPVAILIFFCGPLAAVPVMMAGFASGPDSIEYLYWFHPQLHCYRMSLIEGGTQYPIIAGVEPGDYCLAQRLSLPAFSYLDRFDVMVLPFDQFPEYAGDQYSPFRYLLFKDGPESCPAQKPLVSGQNAYCSNQPCESNILENELRCSLLSGGEYWFGIQWMYETPAAPQFLGVLRPDLFKYNSLGIKEGNEYHWGNSSYLLSLRSYLCGLTKLGTENSVGHLEKMLPQDSPDSFMIEYYGAGEYAALMVGVDTLICPAPQFPIDSAVISPYYDNMKREPYSVAPSVKPRLPLTMELTYAGKHESQDIYLYHLYMSNESVETLSVIIGFDRQWLQSDSIRYQIASLSAIDIAVWAEERPSAQRQIPLVIEDWERQYNPLFVFVEYPPEPSTAVGNESEITQFPSDYVVIFPNPGEADQPINFKSEVLKFEVDIFNILGQKVKSLSANVGNQIAWDAHDRDGQRLAPGIYVARIKMAGGLIKYSKMIILRN